MLSPRKVDTYYNYDKFIKTGASLMVTMLLVDDFYEEGCDILPPHMLEFDLAGALIFDGNTALLEGGEIKSSSSRMFL